MVGSDSPDPLAKGEESGGRRSGSIRSGLALAALCAFVIFEVKRLSASSLSQEWSSFREGLRIAPEEERLHTDFWFDTSYGKFLEAVRARTPPDATIAFDVPRTHELYTYEVQYTLAPRHIVGLSLLPDADYLAVYTPQQMSPSTPDAVLFGRLTRER